MRLCQEGPAASPFRAAGLDAGRQYIDRELRQAGLKYGVVSGYLFWDFVARTTWANELSWLTSSHARPERSGPSIALTLLAGGQTVTWIGVSPSQGDTHCLAEPFVLRPALAAEAPALWYVEDGSGRAVALVIHKDRFDPAREVAHAYVGREPDHGSTFMRQPPFQGTPSEDTAWLNTFN